MHCHHCARPSRCRTRSTVFLGHGVHVGLCQWHTRARATHRSMPALQARNMRGAEPPPHPGGRTLHPPAPRLFPTPGQPSHGNGLPSANAGEGTERVSRRDLVQSTREAAPHAQRQQHTHRLPMCLLAAKRARIQHSTLTAAGQRAERRARMRLERRASGMPDHRSNHGSGHIPSATEAANDVVCWDVDVGGLSGGGGRTSYQVLCRGSATTGTHSATHVASVPRGPHTRAVAARRRVGMTSACARLD